MAYLDDVAMEIHMKYFNRGFFDKQEEEIKELCEITGASKKDAKIAIDKIKKPITKEDKKSARKKQKEIRRAASDNCRKIIEREVTNNIAAENEETLYRNNFQKDKSAHCPRCRSTSIGYDTKKLSVGRGVVGGLMGGLAGGALGEAVGITVGGLSSKKGYAVCLNCGKRWKI